jgi:1-acyl-sn-glycerol-3-phosphate acyltransferase
MKIYAKIRFYWGAFVISTVVALGMIPLLYLFPKKKGKVIHILNRLILKLMGAKVETFGKRDPKANLFIINHQGIMDIIALEAVENTHFRWVAKKELFDAIWFGRLLKKGDMISIDRSNKRGVIKLLKDIKESIEVKNRAVAIFPEGTRAKGQELLPFKVGGKLAADKLKLRVQPIVVTGSKWVLNEHNKTGHSGTIRIHYLEAFDAESAPKDWYQEVKEKMQKVIDEEEKRGILR